MEVSLFTLADTYLPSKCIITTEDRLAYLAERLVQQPYFAFDVETNKIQSSYRDVILAGIGIAFGKESYYIPLNHLSEFTQLPEQTVMTALQPAFGDEKIAKIAHYMKFDVRVVRNYGLQTKGMLLDTLTMAWLMGEKRGDRALQALAWNKLQTRILKYTDINEGDLITAHIRDVAHMCREHAKVTLRLYEYLKKCLQDEKLDTAFLLETELLPVTMRMEDEGMLIDTGAMAVLDAEINAEIGVLEADIYKLAGHKFNINSSDQLAVVLLEELGLRCERRTESGKPSMDEKALLDMTSQHAIIKHILKYKKYRKLQTTYIDGFKPQIREDNKVYATFNQMGTISGRFSSSGPNLQNIPREDDKLHIRSIFITPPGHKLIVADYSQVELRVLAHYSDDPHLLKSFQEGKDVHAETALYMFGELTDELRFIAKNINFGLAYGAGAGKLYEFLRDGGVEMNKDDVEQLLWVHRNKYSRIYEWASEIVVQCGHYGFVRTFVGRKRRLPDIKSDNVKFRSKAERQAVNTIIQGGAADIMKIAMVKLGKSKKFSDLGCKIISQIHDELVVVCPEYNVEEAMSTMIPIMEHPFAQELKVPILVDIGYGDNWGDGKK